MIDLFPFVETLSIATILSVVGLYWRISRDRRIDMMAHDAEIVARTEHRSAVDNRLTILEKDRDEDSEVLKEVRNISMQMATMNTRIDGLCSRLARVEERE